MRIKISLSLALFSLLVAISPAFAQAPTASAGTGKIHGHVQDPATTPMANAQVQLSTDGKDAKYTFTTNANGDYTGSGVAAGTYFATLYQTPGKAVFQIPNVKIVAGQDTTQDFDLSSPAYMNTLPPDQRKAIEEAIKKNASIIQANKGIAHLNGMLKEARSDIQNHKFDDAATLMQQATQQSPNTSLLWLAYGEAQNGQKKYSDAITSLQKAIDLEKASSKPNAQVQAAANNALGEAYASSNKIPEATAAYDAAAAATPADAGMYYTNETIVLSRTSDADATVAAANKAIAADPSKPIPYYLKGQALVSKATVDPKTQKITPPPGCVEAYQKYLQLDPNGQFAAQTKQILAELTGGGDTGGGKHKR